MRPLKLENAVRPLFPCEGGMACVDADNGNAPLPCWVCFGLPGQSYQRPGRSFGRSGVVKSGGLKSTLLKPTFNRTNSRISNSGLFYRRNIQKRSLGGSGCGCNNCGC